MRRRQGLLWVTLGLCGAAGCPIDPIRVPPSIVIEDVSAAAPIGSSSFFAAVSLGSESAGLFRADSETSPWQDVSPVTSGRVYLVASDAMVSTRVYAAGASASENFVYRSDDQGATWTRLTNGLPAATDDTRRPALLESDPDVADRMWLGFHNGSAVGGLLFRSDDRGAAWTDVSPGITRGRAVRGIAWDPATPARRWIHTEETVWRTDDAGASWARDDGGLTLSRRAPVAIAADPGLSGRVLLVLRETDAQGYRVGDELWIRDPLGGQWALRGAVDTPSHEGGPVRALAVDAASPDRLYAATEYSLLLSEDGGGAWSSQVNGLGSSFVTAVVADRLTPLTVLIGTADGVFLSETGALQWRALERQGLPATNASSVGQLPPVN